MYGNGAFKLPTLLSCFGTKATQEVVPLVQIQELVGLLGNVFIPIIVTLASDQHRLQQAVAELGKDLMVDVVFTLKELDGPTSICLGHAKVVVSKL